MRLTDLEPRWLTPDLFVFRCPHCRKTWLSCKTRAMTIKEQFEHFRAADIEPAGPKYGVVPMKVEVAWKVRDRNFASMTVSPSIDASAAKHWHGHITNGDIVGGL